MIFDYSVHLTHKNNFQKHYAPGSPDRKGLEEALASYKQSAPLNVPLVVAGKEVILLLY